MLFWLGEIRSRATFDVFSSPARRGRGILVAPEFCPACGVWRPASRFLVGAKTTCQIVLKF